MFLTWPYTATADPFEHQRNLEPGETRRRLARKKFEEEFTMHLYTHEPAIKAKNERLLNEAILAEQLRIARDGQSGRVARITLNLRRSLGFLLIAAGERLQPADIGPGRTKRPDTAMQA